MGAELDHRAFKDWSAKHRGWVLDGIMLYNDMVYAMFDARLDAVKLLQSRFFGSLFWKNRYVLINQLNRLFADQEEASMPAFFRALQRDDLNSERLEGIQCTDDEKRKLCERCQVRLEAHREVIDRNRVVRNKSIAHGLLKPPPGNVIAWEDLRALVELGMELHRDVELTLFNDEADLDVPEHATLRFVVERLMEAAIDLDVRDTSLGNN